MSATHVASREDATSPRAQPLAELRARARRALRYISALGWGSLAVALAALVLAAAFGWVELLAIAAVLLAAIVLAIPFVLGRAEYAVRVELASARVQVGERAAGRLVIRNVARRPAVSTRVLLPVGDAKAEFALPRLAPEAEHEELFTVPTQRRAVLRLGPVTSTRTDPLGLLRYEVTWTEPTELFVHPRIVRLSGETSGLARDLEGLPTRDLADDDVSFHALREYSPGDDLRHVHWKSTARTQSLMIRQFEQTRRSHLVIALTTRMDEYADPDEFELAVSMAGSIAVSAIREGITATVLASTDIVPSPSAGRLLDGLSGVELARSAASTDLLGRAIAAAAPSASVVYFVTGSATPLPAARSASLRVPATARSACARAVMNGELARRVVGDLVAVDVPDLASLGMALRAVSST